LPSFNNHLEEETQKFAIEVSKFFDIVFDIISSNSEVAESSL
jgi:hypothetical protein